MTGITSPLLKWPITANLNVFSRKSGRDNLIYLAKVAFLTRLGIGVVRVLENHPSQVKDPDVSLVDKKKSFYERIFIEIFGTSGYIFSMHVAQDIAAKWHEVNNQDLLENTRKIVHSDLRDLGNTDTSLKEWISPDEIEAAIKKFDTEFKETFGEKASGLINRSLSGKDVKKDGVILYRTGTQDELMKRLRMPSMDPDNPGKVLLDKIENSVLLNKIEQTVSKHFTSKLNILSSKTILFGVVVGAAFGGFAIQWLNDRILAPILKRIYGSSSRPVAPTPQGYFTPAPTTPSFSQQVSPQQSQRLIYPTRFSAFYSPLQNQGRP